MKLKDLLIAALLFSVCTEMLVVQFGYKPAIRELKQQLREAQAKLELAEDEAADAKEDALEAHAEYSVIAVKRAERTKP